MFSRSSTTKTPLRISNSKGRLLLLLMMKVVLPAGTVKEPGSHAVSVTATATSGLAVGAAGAAVFSTVLGAGAFSPHAARVKEAKVRHDAAMSLKFETMIIL